MRGSRRYPTPRGKGSCRGPDKLETLIGECGSIGAPPTIVHAVLDALARFDIDNLDVPMMPLKVWTAICGTARQACKRRTAQATSSRKEGKWTMSLTIEAIDRTNRPFFAGVASDCDLSRPLSPSDISSIHAGWTVSACCYSATSRSMTATRSTLTGVWGRSSKPWAVLGRPRTGASAWTSPKFSTSKRTRGCWRASYSASWLRSGFSHTSGRSARCSRERDACAPLLD